MSYSFQNTCYNCKKKADCTDPVKLQAAISDIHSASPVDGKGHLGGGQIIILCQNHDQA